eukprot:scaffold307602_cov30-Prasinocladus_malaysianus.AAC.1
MSGAKPTIATTYFSARWVSSFVEAMFLLLVTATPQPGERRAGQAAGGHPTDTASLTGGA